MYPQNYNNLSHEKQKEHWVRVLYKDMLKQGAKGFESTSIFVPELIAELRLFDPNIDQLFPAVIRSLSTMSKGNEAEFFAKVNVQMETDF